jgi:tetratricopeptide (TPR) repeat protein
MTPERAKQLFDDAGAFVRQNALDDAEKAARELVDAFESPQGIVPEPERVNYGMALAVLANVVLNRKGAQAAVDLFSEALARMPDVPSLRRAGVFLNFARLFEYIKQRGYLVGAAARAISDATEGARKLDSEALGIVIEALTIQRQAGARTEEAVTVLQAALSTAQSSEPEDWPLIARLHQALRDALLDARRYREAQPHAEFMVGVMAVRHGSESAEVGDAHMDYGLALDQSGRYRDAEHQYRTALRILQRQRGRQDRSVTVARQNLAELARVLGDLEEAARQFRVLETEDRERNPDPSARNAQLLVNYGRTLTSLHRYAEAAETLNAARDIYAERNGVESPRYARVLLALGQLAQARDRHEEAVKLLEESARIRDACGHGADADYARFEAAVSALHLSDPDAATSRARGLIRAAKERLGATDPEVVTMLTHFVHHQADRLTESGGSEQFLNELRADLEEVDDIGRFALVEILSALGERALAAALDQRRQLQILHLSLVMAETQMSQQSIDRAWRFLARYRSAETTALRLRARRYLQYDPSPRRDRIAKLKKEIEHIDLELSGEQDDAQLRSDRDRYVDELSDEEFALAASTSQYRLDLEFIGDEPPRIELDSASAVLVVSQYVRYPHGGLCYAMFVIGPAKHPVRLVDLGDVEAIDKLIRGFRQALVDEGRRAEPNEVAWRSVGMELSSRLFEPLRPLLGGVRTLRVLADGAIAFLSLGTLPRREGGHLLDEFDITYDLGLKTFGSVLFEEDTGIDGPPVVIGAPQYTTYGEGKRDDAHDDTEFLAQFRDGGRFEPLANSETECCEIAKLLKVSPLLREEATEAAFTALRGPEILHVSTHGFFLEVQADNDKRAAAPFGFLARRRGLTASLARTGLAFSGANDYLDGRPCPPGTSDGILYGSEIADCDFMRTDLVTLSACQTGLGDVARGDGVHGLQRAFLSAGARTVICSLWEVPDRPTKELFTRFYARVLAEEPRGQAFHRTVRELAAAYPRHPIAWGGFTLVGETEKLARFTIRTLKIVSLKLPHKEAEDGSPATQAERSIDRAESQARAGDVNAAIELLTEGLRDQTIPAALRARMLYSRAGIKRKAGRLEDALADYRELEGLPDLPARLRQSAIFDAGTTHILAKNPAGAVERYTTYLNGDLAPEDVAMALVNRAFAYASLGDPDRAVADFTSVIDGAHMPPNQRAKARVGRAELRLGKGDLASAVEDADSIINQGGEPSELAGAYLIRGMASESGGSADEARQFYARARDVPGQPAHTLELAKKLLSQLDGS